MTPAQRATALLGQATSRGAIKRLAKEVEADPVLRTALLVEGRRRGAELPDEALNWPAKRLLRLARGKEAESRVRMNPIRRDEGFQCQHCGADVQAHGRTARDHCPYCLRSLHVDVVPGDRSANCGGILDPVGADTRGSEISIRYICRTCGAARRNRAIPDGDPPDDWNAVIRLTVVQ